MTYTIKTKRRVNITLEEKTIRRLDRFTERGERSRLIEEAVDFYLRELSRAELRKRLKTGALARRERDYKLAHEWFLI